MSELFRKVAEVTIGEKVFKYPPFTIEFESEQTYGQSGRSTIRLYNPNDDTIGSCDPQKEKGKNTKYTICKVKAGYEGNIKSVIDGIVVKYDVFRDDKNRILEMTVINNEQFFESYVSKPYTKQTVQFIIKDITQGLQTDFKFGEKPDIELDSYTTSSGITKAGQRFRVYEDLAKLTNLIECRFFFRNGILSIRPVAKVDNNAMVLDYTSGLIGVPEKITRPAIDSIAYKRPAYTGYRIQTLFLPQLAPLDQVRIKYQSKDENKKPLDFQGEIEYYKLDFSTYRSTVSEFDLRPVK